MSAVSFLSGSCWTPSLLALRQRIEAHPFGSGDASGFADRLAGDYGWTLAFARDAIAEYGRFCFLAMATPGPVTPSEEVDEVWHLHLIYSRDYWTVWCREVLRAELHHDPAKGGPAEQRRYWAQYAQTLAAYEAFFGPPPPAFWPATHRRFGGRPRFGVLDRTRSLALPRPGRLLARGS